MHAYQHLRCAQGVSFMPSGVVQALAYIRASYSLSHCGSVLPWARLVMPRWGARWSFEAVRNTLLMVPCCHIGSTATCVHVVCESRKGSIEHVPLRLSAGSLLLPNVAWNVALVAGSGSHRHCTQGTITHVRTAETCQPAAALCQLSFILTTHGTAL